MSTRPGSDDMLPAESREHCRSSGFDHSSDPHFYSYYAQESLSDTAVARFKGTMDKVLALGAREGVRAGPLEVVDIGCGAGTQSRLWAEAGHRVHGLDVNEPLIQLARARAAAAAAGGGDGGARGPPARLRPARGRQSQTLPRAND